MDPEDEGTSTTCPMPHHNILKTLIFSRELEILQYVSCEAFTNLEHKLVMQLVKRFFSPKHPDRLQGP
jgi:hypothetical protein